MSPLPWWPRWGWLVVLAAVLIGACYVVWYRAVRALGRLREWHHVHFSPPLFVAGVALLWVAPALGLAAIGVAVWIAADDAAQHRTQLTNPHHRSFLHRLAHRLGLI